MSLRLFYHPGIASAQSTFVLPEETSKHIIQVLRMKKEDAINVTDGKGNLVTATITNADKKATEIKADAVSFSPQKSPFTSIAISILKNASRFEWFLEKAAETGIQQVIPLLCNRTEKQHFRWERMHQILISAMLQSNQVWLPELFKPAFSNDIIQQPFNGKKYIAHCGDGEKTFVQNIISDEKIEGVRILIGPEGDFTSEELSLSLQNKFIPLSLGSSRLRTETAGMAAAVWLSALHYKA